MRTSNIVLWLAPSVLILGSGCGGSSPTAAPAVSASQPDTGDSAGDAVTQEPGVDDRGDAHSTPAADGPVIDGISWLSWRGPNQNGASSETGLPDTLNVESDVTWTLDYRGRGCPVYANGRVFGMAYTGEGADLQEILYCVDATTGDVVWEHRFSDFLSDSIYERYSIGSPSIDPETGNVYCMTVPGLMNCFTSDGEPVWQLSMMEAFGRFTYPNGRTMGPLVDGDMVIYDFMNSTWGRTEGPARNRFFGFDKMTGELVWMTNPSGPPKDAPYSHPVFEWRDGQRLMYAGTAGGLLVCVNVRTGEPVWSYRMTIGGVCSSPVIHGDRLIALHGRENIDSSGIGRMIAIDLTKTPVKAGPEGQIALDRSYEVWRNDLGAFTSSPVLAGDRVYQTTSHGQLACIDAYTGEVLWSKKLAPDQIHASPTWADGKLYVPMNNGSFYVIRPTDDGPEILSETQLAGNCLGAPLIANGSLYLHTTEKLYCFGGDAAPDSGAAMAAQAPAPGPATGIQAIPADVLLQPGDSIPLRVRTIDANGLVCEENITVLALGDTPLGISYDNGMLYVATDAAAGAAVVPITSNGMADSIRVRIVDSIPFTYDFDNMAVNQTTPSGEEFGLAPGHWIQARGRWDVRTLEDGNNVLAKTTANLLLQRGMGFIGDPDMSDYTMQVDVMSEGNRRMMSTVGVVHQRYLVMLKCNSREFEIQSTEHLVKHAIDYRFKADTWYTLKTRVDVDDAGVATIHAKVWERESEEPADWTIEYVHTKGHTHGSPGIYGFALQNRFKVFMDNLRVTPNEH